MESMVGMLMSHLSGDNLSMIGKLVGGDSNSAKSILSTAVPLLMGVMANTAAKPGGADTLARMTEGGKLDSVVDNTGGYLQNPDVAGGTNILSSLLGGQQGTVVAMIAQKTGFSTESIGKVLAVVAPLVVGFVGKMMRQQNMDTSALTSFLGEQSKMALAGAPDATGIMNTLMGASAGSQGFLGRLKRLFGG
jgi:hypothetical protein